MGTPDLRAILDAKVDALQSAITQKRTEVERAAAELKDLQSALVKLFDAFKALNDLVPEAKLSIADGSLFDPLPDRDAVHNPPAGESDLTGCTVLESAVAILKERAPRAVHYRDLAAAAFARGYRSPKKGEDIEAIEKNFWDTLRRVKNEAGVPLVFEGAGRFRYESNKSEVREEVKAEEFAA